jgi:hypothetical protein
MNRERNPYYCKQVSDRKSQLDSHEQMDHSILVETDTTRAGYSLSQWLGIAKHKNADIESSEKHPAQWQNWNIQHG